MIGFREPGMLPHLRIVLEAIHSLSPGLVLLGLWHVDASAKKRGGSKMLRAIREPASDTPPAVSPLFGRFLRERSDP